MLCLSVYNARGRYSSILSTILVLEAWSTFVYTSISSQYATFNLDCENSYLYVIGGSSHTTRTFSGAVLLLFSLDNVICCSVFNITKRCEHLFVPLQIDTFPCEPTEDDVLAVFMQLLPWVYIIMYIIHICACICVIILLLLSLII